MTLTPRPSFIEIAAGESYARRIRRAAAMAQGRLTLAQARQDARAWDAIWHWSQDIYCIAGPWRGTADDCAAAAGEVRKAAAAATTRASKDAEAALREGRIPADLTALADALAALADFVRENPTGATARNPARAQEPKIPPDPADAGHLTEIFSTKENDT
jgi:hypothetical protein